MKRLVALAGALGLAAGLIAAAVPVSAQTPASVPSGQIPTGGFGSPQEPMSEHQGSGLAHEAIFRFFNPCAALPNAYESTGQRLMVDGYGVPKAPGSSEFVGERSLRPFNYFNGEHRRAVFGTFEATLHCEKLSIPPYKVVDPQIRCEPSTTIQVGDSVAFTHQVGPVVFPSMTWIWMHNPRPPSLMNWGWVTADLDLWVLCTDR